MRIGIDGRFLNHPESGHGTYSFELIKNLSEIDEKNQYIIFCPPNYKFNISKSNFTYIKTEIAHYSLAEQLSLTRLIKKQNLDLMHFVHFNKPINYKDKTIVTIHDLILSRFKSSKTNPIKQMIYNYIIRSTINSADKIIAVSEFTKKEILAEYNKVRENKIDVIYEGYNSRFRPVTNKSLIKNTISGYNITKPYIIYLGQQRPHKNLVRLVAAFAQLRKKGIDYQMVFVGNKNLEFKELFEEIEKHHLKNSVIFTGFVPDEKLPVLINGAKLLAMPSLLEGFGLPILEGMACQVPVVASNISSLPEIGGRAINYFDPFKVENMAETLYETLTNKLLRKKLIKESESQLKKFSWQKMAKQTRDLYEIIGKGEKGV